MHKERYMFVYPKRHAIYERQNKERKRKLN